MVCYFVIFEGEMSSSPTMSGSRIEGHQQPSTSHSSTPISILSEQRRLFNFGKRKSLPSCSHTKATKSKKVSKCTIEFCCLGSKDAHKPPNSIKDRTELCNMGLGDKSITFILDGSPSYATILEHYPKLKDAGGFDLMLFQRGSGEDAGFHVINAPHTPGHLKDLCGQSKIYLRPLQKDIITAENTAEIEVELGNDEEVNKSLLFLYFISIKNHDQAMCSDGHSKGGFSVFLKRGYSP